MSVAGYAGVWGALLALLAATVGAAYADLGLLNVPVMLGIAVAKTALVLRYFMHLKGALRVNVLYALGGFVWLAILLVHTLADYLTRDIQ